jgi:hypothetical protein
MAEKNPTDFTLLHTAIYHTAALVGGSILLLAASVLFVGAAIADAGGAITIIALLNAAMFYLLGMACIKTILSSWHKEGKRMRDENSA